MAMPPSGYGKRVFYEKIKCSKETLDLLINWIVEDERVLEALRRHAVIERQIKAAAEARF